MLGFEENTIRLLFFLSTLLLCASLEQCFPRKARVQSRRSRWLANFSLVLINSLVLRLMGPITAISAALYAQAQGWGLLSLWQLPVVLEVFFAVIALDGSIYIQHVLSHKIPLLWRLHRVHHVDRDIDVTTGIRFHPIEVILSMLFKCVVIVLLGAPVFAVFVFEVLLNISPMFNHANIRLPLWLDRYLRMVIVTPDMHRIHHSVVHTETDSNYGFCLSWWDYLCRTYTSEPLHGHEAMTIGLKEHQHEFTVKPLWCLRFPFLSNRREIE